MSGSRGSPCTSHGNVAYVGQKGRAYVNKKLLVIFQFKVVASLVYLSNVVRQFVYVCDVCRYRSVKINFLYFL